MDISDIQFDKYEPEYLLSRECLYNNPKVFYEFYRQKMDTRNIEPNITHKVLAKMEEMGKLRSAVDAAEALTGGKYLDYPTYGELLFGVNE